MFPRRYAGIGPFSRHDVAVLLAQLHAHVGVELEIQRADLIPQPVHLLGEIASAGMSYFDAPHRPGIREAELLRALVRELGEARVVLLHRRRNRVPAFPLAAQLGCVPRRGEHARDLVDVVARVGLGRVGTPLALAVHAAHLRDELGQLLGLLGIGRRGEDERDLQEIELPPLLGGQLDLVELGRLLGELRGRVGDLLGRPRVERFGVVRDEVLRDPAGLTARQCRVSAA